MNNEYLVSRISWLRATLPEIEEMVKTNKELQMELDMTKDEIEMLEDDVYGVLDPITRD